MQRFQEFAAPAPLAAHVHALWEFDAGDTPPPVHHVPPDGCVSLVVAPTPAGVQVTLVGPRATSVAVPLATGVRYRGLRMRPEAAGLLIDLAPRDWLERVGPLESADAELARASAGCTVADVFDRLLAALTLRAGSAAAPDVLVATALEAMDAGVLRTDALAARLGVSARTLQRRFAGATGLSPKAFMRIRRFRMAAANMLSSAPAPWGRVAMEHGYADQAHLARDFAAIAGAAPTALAARLGDIRHVDVKP